MHELKEKEFTEKENIANNCCIGKFLGSCLSEIEIRSGLKLLLFVEVLCHLGTSVLVLYFVPS